MKISIVTTLYYSAPYLNEFYDRIVATVKKITEDYEIIFVNDGSPDQSLPKALALYKADPKVIVIDLARNFGHHKAIMTGLSKASGDYVFLVDCDLEEPPELLADFWQNIQQDSDCDVVFGVQEVRKGGFIEKHFGGWFYTTFNMLSEYKLTPNMVIARLMSKRYVASLVEHQESDVVFFGLCEITGFKQMALPMQKGHKGLSTYNFKRKLNLLVNAITSFSSKPLTYIFNLGLLLLVSSLIMIANLLLKKFFFGIALAGWTSLIVSIWFFGGLIVFCLGVIGIYLAKIFNQTKNRPYTIIKQLYKH